MDFYITKFLHAHGIRVRKTKTNLNIGRRLRHEEAMSIIGQLYEKIMIVDDVAYIDFDEDYEYNDVDSVRQDKAATDLYEMLTNRYL